MHHIHINQTQAIMKHPLLSLSLDLLQMRSL